MLNYHKVESIRSEIASAIVAPFLCHQDTAQYTNGEEDNGTEYSAAGETHPQISGATSWTISSDNPTRLDYYRLLCWRNHVYVDRLALNRRILLRVLLGILWWILLRRILPIWNWLWIWNYICIQLAKIFR